LCSIACWTADGALARRRGLTDAGGFLDISLDFLFYALVPFGFILADPRTTLAGGWLLFAFIGTGSSFSPLPRWRQSIRSIIRATPTNRFIISAG
jgi:phosphatidylglycerophosphate synthase